MSRPFDDAPFATPAPIEPPAVADAFEPDPRPAPPGPPRLDASTASPPRLTTDEAGPAAASRRRRNGSRGPRAPKPPSSPGHSDDAPVIDASACRCRARGPLSGGVTMITPDQVAARWQLDVKKVYDLLKSGQIPSVRVDKQYRISLAVLDRIEQGRVVPGGA